MSLRHELLYNIMYNQHASTPVGLATSAKPKYVTLKVMFGYCCLYCGIQKLYYVLPPGYIIIGQSAPGIYSTISNKSTGN